MCVIARGPCAEKPIGGAPPLPWPTPLFPSIPTDRSFPGTPASASVSDVT